MMSDPRWLVGATVVDGTGADPFRTDVRIDDGLITDIGSAPTGAHTVDLTGCTLTPGLIEAHVHLGPSSSLQALLAGKEFSVAQIAANMFENTKRPLLEGFTTVGDCGQPAAQTSLLCAATSEPLLGSVDHKSDSVPQHLLS